MGISLGTGAAGTVAWVVLLAIYFLPTIVAIVRHHHQTGAILLTNLLLGWTLLGWIAALIWSATAVRKPEPQVVYVMQPNVAPTPATAAEPVLSIDPSASRNHN
ncbi:superinfection immunity protein [Bradyrhizobium sp. LA2.1]|uniref:superinfection immunity protein n=1 Tax=Bradyrhizobium sp. LA2.1 TaxID=3156376 RepID=UPI003390A8B7